MTTAIKKCPECDSVNLTYDPHLGEIICNDCGLVVEEKMVDSGMDLHGKFDKSEKKIFPLFKINLWWLIHV